MIIHLVNTMGYLPATVVPDSLRDLSDVIDSMSVRQNLRAGAWLIKLIGISVALVVLLSAFKPG